MIRLRPSPFRLSTALILSTFAACGPATDDSVSEERAVISELSTNQKLPRYERIREVAARRGIHRNAFLLAGIANDETGLAHCWSEATWACAGPRSPDCGGGAVIAGAADGPCNIQQGGLGMFQFDSGTYGDTLRRYGDSVLTVDGQVERAIDYVIDMVWTGVYTPTATNRERALAWINAFNVHDAAMRDQWIKTVVRHYNGCQPSWSCWASRYRTYTDGLWLAVNEPGGLEYWARGGAQEAGTSCNGSPAAVGAIEAKYLELGGCGSFLGAPESEERATPDGAGRYSVFENGSIYWTQATGAHEVHGLIRDEWAALGWEQGALGYPVTDEYTVAGGRRSDFQRGSISWDSTTNQITVNTATGPRWRVLEVDFQIQETGYWCGPAATRVALSTHMSPPPSQGTLARELGTTTNGTDWIGQITNVLNRRLEAPRYSTVEMPNDPPTQAQRDRLWRDVVLSIDNNYPVVTNIVAPPSNHPPGYPNRTIYHYFSVIGYDPDTRQVYIADSANFGGNTLYWLSFDQLATLIPPKGYSTYACPNGLTAGAIDEKYRALGGCSSVVGGAVTGELATPDGVGRYNIFERGSIYWTPETGAFEVHGRIRDTWAQTGWESGSLGYPVSDEYVVPEGRRGDFQNASIVWIAATNETRVVPR